MLAATWIALSASVWYKSEAVDNDWQAKWRRVVLTATEEAQAEKDMDQLIKHEMAATARKNSLDKADQPRRYAPLDLKNRKIGDRWKPLCRMNIFKLAHDKSGDIAAKVEVNKICTCSFVKPDIVLTAAHCFFPPKGKWGEDTPWGAGEAMDATPKTGFMVYVVAQYGFAGANAKDHLRHTVENAQVIVEWWTPQKYTGLEAEFEKNSHADVAFAKVRNKTPEQRGRKTYILRRPEGRATFNNNMADYSIYDNDDECRLDTMALGYATAYKDAEVAVEITGTVRKCVLAGRSFELVFTGQEKRDKNDKSPLVGSMGPGGSGGPWLIANTDIRKDDALWMAVVGLTGSGNNKGENADRQSEGPMFTLKLIEAFQQIAKLKLEFSLKQPAAGIATVTSSDSENSKTGVERVTIHLSQ